jgi:2-oxo-4-hydroxy-4-carboxy-5-ureidoimidazoline decarboxylase
MKAEPGRQHYTMLEVNGWDRSAFTRIIGPVFEHSPWVAERTWPKRPFADRGALHRQLCETASASTDVEKLELIRAHPDLVGRSARTGALTASSANEQASAGLDKLTADEVRLFDQLNHAYREKFDFPFVICARLNKKAAILEGFRTRLTQARADEIQTALEEIGKIAYLRLQDLIHA